MLSELSIKDPVLPWRDGRGSSQALWEPKKRRTVAGGAVEAWTDSAVTADGTLWAANRYVDGGMNCLLASWTEIAESWTNRSSVG